MSQRPVGHAVGNLFGRVDLSQLRDLVERTAEWPADSPIELLRDAGDTVVVCCAEDPEPTHGPTPDPIDPPAGSLGTGTGQPVAERAAAGQQDGQPESARQILAEVIAGALRVIKPAHPDPAGWLTQVLLDFGYRPPAQLIVTAESLGALPDKTIIRTHYGTAAQKFDDVWEFPNEVGQYLGDAIDMPATVLWSPHEVRGAHDGD